MSRLPTLTPTQVIAALHQGGFEQIRQVGRHVHLRHPNTRRRTIVPLHSGDLKRPLLKSIIKQAGLSEDQFKRLL